MTLWGGDPEYRKVAALAVEVQQARQRIASLEQAVRAAEWSGDPGTDPNGLVCPFCGRAHFETAWANGERDHAYGCIVLTLPKEAP